MAKIQRPSVVRRPSTVSRPSIVRRPSTSTSARTSSTTKKTDPIITTKIVKVSNSFTLYGNRDATVEVVKRGDGDLNASSSRIVKVSATPTLTYDSNTGNVKASVKITTQAYEKDYNKGSKRDYLKFSKTITQQLQVGKGRTEIGKGAKNSNNKFDCYEITEVTAVPFSPNNQYGSVTYKSYYPGDTEGFRNLSPYDFPNDNQHQEWMTMEDIQVQVNNKGSELSGTNNFAVKGVMNFYFKVTTKTWKEYTVDKATNKAKVVTKPAKYGVITDGKVLPSLKEVLGFGYDITGSYCDTSSIQHSVVNFDAVNQLQRIKQSNSRAHVERKTISGESLEEYSHKLESSLNVKVSAACFGASFSSDTTTTSSEETSTSENRKFAQFKSVFKNREYEMLIDYKNNLDPALLQPTFLDDLNTSDAATIIHNYGTHVLLGGIFGASAFYNMSYIKSVSNMSTATSFTNTTSIGYSPTGGTSGGKEKTEKKSAIAKLVDELNVDQLSDAKFKSIMETYQKELESQNKAKEDSKKSDSKPKQNGFSGTTTYTESETESFSFENETTNAFGIVFGGDTVLAADIKSGELEKIVEWEKKLDHYNIKQDNHVWCDFIPGTLIPIYEFIPVGYKVTPEDVRKEWTLYIESKGKAMLGAKQKMLRYPNKLIIRSGSGSIKNLAKELGHGDSDTEISTKDNKTTGWKVRFELVNLDNGNVAIVVQLTVGESGLSANRTLLMLHQPLEVTNNQDQLTVIDTTKCKSVYEVSGNIYREEHKLIDVTRFFYDCPFLDFENNKTNKVFIGIDGGGGDEKNLRLEIDNFYLPVLVNEEA